MKWASLPNNLLSGFLIFEQAAAAVYTVIESVRPDGDAAALPGDYVPPGAEAGGAIADAWPKCRRAGIFGDHRVVRGALDRGCSIRDWLGPDAIERIRAKSPVLRHRLGLPVSLRFSRLDRLAVRKLEPGEKITEHGITVERLANGDLRYSVNVMVDGLRIHRVIGKESDGVPGLRPRSSSSKPERMRGQIGYRCQSAASFTSHLRGGGSLPQETEGN